MTTDDYVNFKKSTMFSSYEEADLEGKKSILYSKCNLEPKNINAWIDFVRLQVKSSNLFKLFLLFMFFFYLERFNGVRRIRGFKYFS